MALSLLAMAFANPIADRSLSPPLPPAQSFCRGRIVGTDALAMIFWPRIERSRANGDNVIRASSRVVVLGGQACVGRRAVAVGGCLWLGHALLLVPSTLVLGVRQSPCPKQRPRLLA